MEADRVARERERINALHDAIAIVVAELSRNDNALGDAIVGRLRDEENKMMTEYPPDDRGMKHPWPAELSLLCETIERFARERPHPRLACESAASMPGLSSK
jgi:hypothetical protein